MIYILSTKLNAILSKMAGFITDKYTHVSISFEASFSELVCRFTGHLNELPQRRANLISV